MAAGLSALADRISLTPQEALSGVFGSISLASWIVVLVPQFLENYRNGNADAISLPFLIVWFIGDIANLAGALWARLVPTVIALAVYFCLADAILLSQCLYYRHRNKRRDAARRRKASLRSASSTTEEEEREGEEEEEDPLLATRRMSAASASNMGLPGSRRRSSAASRRRRSSDALERILEADTKRQAWIKNTVSVLLTCVVGAAGWAIAWSSGAWRPAPVEDGRGVGQGTPVGAEVLWYFSAVCYLGARLPQIYKNYADKSTAGLSLLFFLLSILGNLTYGAGILFHSLDRAYIIKNIPWLVGSLGTIAEDLIIGFEFHLYGEAEGAEAVI